jgi:hypothetical protein
MDGCPAGALRRGCGSVALVPGVHATRPPAGTTRRRPVRLPVHGRPERTWLRVEKGDAELCAFDPGFGEDVFVTINDPLTFARWHFGHIRWATTLRSGGVSVMGTCRRPWNVTLPRAGRSVYP